MDEITRLFGRSAKRELIARIVNKFFDDDTVDIERALFKIGRDNQSNQTNSNWDEHYEYFYYLGIKLPIDNPAVKHPIQLNEEFFDKVDSLLTKLSTIKYYKNAIAAHLRKVMVRCKTITDIYTLMPEELQYTFDNELCPYRGSSLRTVSTRTITALCNSEGAAQAKAYLFHKAMFVKD